MGMFDSMDKVELKSLWQKVNDWLEGRKESPTAPSRDHAIEDRVQAWAYRHGPYPGDIELALAIQWCIEGWAYQRSCGLDVLASAELEQAIELSQFAQELYLANATDNQVRGENMDSKKDETEDFGSSDCSSALRVERAAIRTNEGQVFSVDPPMRHHDVIRVIRESGYEGPVGGDRQGFVLSNGRFVMRKAALRVAIKAGQVSRDKCHAPAVGLFSEDVW